MGLCGSSSLLTKSQVNSSRIKDEYSNFDDTQSLKVQNNQKNIKCKARIGERELDVYIKKNSKIEITYIDDNASFLQFYPDKKLTNISGDENIKYKNKNIGCLLARISTSKIYYSSENNIIKFTAQKSGSLMLSFNLNPNNYCIYEPNGIIKLLIKGGEWFDKTRIDELTEYKSLLYENKNNQKCLNLVHKEISRYINKARSNIIKYIDDFILDDIDKNINIKQTKNLPLCQINNKLFQIAEEHCLDLCSNGTSGHIGTDGSSFKERIERYKISDKCDECIIYGISNPILIVNYLIIDKYSKTKENRKKLLNKKFSKIGISLNKHISFRYCCVIVFQE